VMADPGCDMVVNDVGGSSGSGAGHMVCEALLGQEETKAESSEITFEPR
jgi:hypothetical protein